MTTSRRAFMASLAASLAVPRLSWADAGSPAYLAAAREPDGGYALFGLSATGQDLFRVPLPGRGHAGAAHPDRPEAVAFARRPGTFGLVIDCVSGQVDKVLQSPPGRHFMGHGTFLAGGDILVTPENEYETPSGVLGLWSRRQGYRRIGEIPTHGIGPHEVLQISENVLVVANGGIRTHPAQGRDKLNLPTMRPSLAYVDLDGRLLDQVVLAPELHHNSIRHLSLGQGGQVAFAMQWEGDVMESVPLLGLHRLGQGAPLLAQADLAEQLAMKGYAGSVAFSGDGRRVAITSPRGGRLHVFDAAGGFLESHRRGDICGLARAPGGFFATDGQGGVWQAGRGGFVPQAGADRNWDNHVVAL
ncbi:DUF1513 domain-containing protein [Pseudooceanicola sp. CBS1P-1]|uniref:DUF1513 domain-containing protein n=1 Tax=Pseudooceanicola albus TaxID=2692189 RepID=A0A6L7G5U2_9RHOB|nr:MULTISPECIES: DUF1513 domain-containing protein [Pseudooceanicola]MBT9383091.1 DUF1513 domain-containing protein [Pseudooceanicola endophyticus]MXN19279.1 DUF1513 domain-containing protein [Pseudooceanicola albus]